MLDTLLVVPDGAQVSELDRLRRGPMRISDPQMVRALERAAEIAALGVGEADVSGCRRGSWRILFSCSWFPGVPNPDVPRLKRDSVRKRDEQGCCQGHGRLIDRNRLKTLSEELAVLDARIKRLPEHEIDALDDGGHGV